jgi:hypothetical protein
MLKLELFWSSWLVPGMSSTEVARGLHENCIGYQQRIFGGGSVSGTLWAAIYSSKSRFASPKLDSRVVIRDQTAHL